MLIGGAAQDRASDGHHQRRGHALARDVGDRKREAAVVGQECVIEVAADIQRRSHECRHARSRVLWQIGGYQGRLDRVGHLEVVADLALRIFERQVLLRQFDGSLFDQGVELDFSRADFPRHVEEDPGQFAVLVSRQRCVAQRRRHTRLGLASGFHRSRSADHGANRSRQPSGQEPTAEHQRHQDDHDADQVLGAVELEVGADLAGRELDPDCAQHGAVHISNGRRAGVAARRQRFDHGLGVRLHDLPRRQNFVTRDRTRAFRRGRQSCLGVEDPEVTELRLPVA